MTPFRLFRYQPSRSEPPPQVDHSSPERADFPSTGWPHQSGSHRPAWLVGDREQWTPTDEHSTPHVRLPQRDEQQQARGAGTTASSISEPDSGEASPRSTSGR